MEQNNKIDQYQQQIYELHIKIDKLTNLIERIGQLIKLCPICKNNIMLPTGAAVWPPIYRCTECNKIDVLKNIKDNKYNKNDENDVNIDSLFN
jgi:hypothetical protein